MKIINEIRIILGDNLLSWALSVYPNGKYKDSLLIFLYKFWDAQIKREIKWM